MPTMRQTKKANANGRASAPDSSEDMGTAPPRASFDPRLGDELARLKLVPQTQPVLPAELQLFKKQDLQEPAFPDAFDHYKRELTPYGGVRITYRDVRRHWVLSTARLIAWAAGTIFAVRLLVRIEVSLLASVLLIIAGSVWWAVRIRANLYKVHCLEVHPDGLIVDGRFFGIEHIGENWPTLHFKHPNDPSRYVLRGIVGTRLIDFATVNRVDANDRMPERLSQDLDLAMEQLWGRREAIFGMGF